MFVKPADGLSVRDPVKLDLLPPEGREVPDGDLYWQRRLDCGDCVIANAVRATKPAAPKPALAEGSTKE